MPTAFESFGSMAERYDPLVRRAVPRYDEMLSLHHVADKRALFRRLHAHDRNESVPDQLAWLGAAGFREADCVRRDLMWGILTARA
jgi:hypothetical protein